MPTATNGRIGRFPVNAAPSAGGLKRNALKRETRLEKPNAIGELNERSLHRALKARYATPGSIPEQAVDGFGPSNPALAGVLDDFLAEPENLAKGPYLSIALPFQPAPEGGEPFPEVPLGFTPYRPSASPSRASPQAPIQGATAPPGPPGARPSSRPAPAPGRPSASCFRSWTTAARNPRRRGSRPSSSIP